MNDVPPDEAVAIGCAMFGATYLGTGIGSIGDANATTDTAIAKDYDVLAEEEVLLCPIGIGLSYQEGDPAATVLIESGSPLPAHSTITIDVTGIPSNNSMSLVQINDNGDEKVVGRIENFDSGASKELEVITELSIEGKLMVSLNGDPICTI